MVMSTCPLPSDSARADFILSFTPFQNKMKFYMYLITETTVIYLLAVCVVAPVSNELGEHGRRSPGEEAAPPVADVDADNRDTAGARPTGPSIRSKEATVSPAVSPSPHPFTKDSTVTTNCTAGNGTECGVGTGLNSLLQNNKGMLQRAIYVLVAVTVVILVYFALRTWSTRKRRSKAKKYGLITTPASDLEMTPLDQEEDDEDMTVFEVNGLHK